MFPAVPARAEFPSKMKVPGIHEGVGVAVGVAVGAGVGVAVGAGVGVGVPPGQPNSSLCSLNVSSGVVSLTLAAITTTLPTLFAALKTAQREVVRVVLLSSRAPRLVKKASLNVLWLAIGFVFVPIHTDISLSPL